MRAALAFAVSATVVLPSAAGDFGDERAVTQHLDHAAIAGGEIALADVLAHGRALFDARFTSEDGAGRPAATAAESPTKRPASDGALPLRTSGPDAASCAGCHNQPVNGGAGDFAANAFVAPQDLEYSFDSIAAELSMERGTPHLFGSGLLELLAREMSADLLAVRDATAVRARAEGAPVRARLQSKGVDFGWIEVDADGFVDVSGLDGVDTDLIVKPFSHKGVTTSLRQFSVNAANMHHGMQASERFGERWTDEADFDADGHVLELSAGDLTALTLFQASLPLPGQVMPEDGAHAEAVAEGEGLFAEIGCASCHVPALPLRTDSFAEPGPFNPAGTLRASEAAPFEIALDSLVGWPLPRDADGQILVPAFTDLKRHSIADQRNSHFANEKLTHHFVPRDVFRTTPLWGVADTGPYGHRGDLTTLRSAILAHGGDGAAARQGFEQLDEREQRRVIAFLQSLRLPQPAAADITEAMRR